MSNSGFRLQVIYEDGSKIELPPIQSYDGVFKAADEQYKDPKVEATRIVIHEGYCISERGRQRGELPIVAGQHVKIRKGAKVKNLRKGVTEAKQTYTVQVHHTLGGYFHDAAFVRPRVCWAGTGGYWSECDVRDVEVAS